MANGEKRRRPGIDAARQAYLYGQGDGKPVVSTQKLAEIADCTDKTILKWIPEWKQEKEEILLNSPSTTLGLMLSEKDLAAHKSDMEFLRSNINQIKWEMDNLDNIIEKFEEICGNFSLNSENGDDAIKLFDRYLRASLNKSSLRAQFLAAQKQFFAMSGVGDLKDIEAVRAREIAKGKGKMDLKKLEAEENQGPKNITRTGVFARPALEAGE